MTTLIMGIGNVLRGDDGIGPAAIAALTGSTLPPGVDLLDAGTAGFELVLLMQGYERVLIIDAADCAAAPGAWRTFTPDAVQLQGRDLELRGTLHYAGLAEALNLGAALDLLPSVITIIGVQPVTMDWQPGLSDAVAAALPEICAAALAWAVEAQPIA